MKKVSLLSVVLLVSCSSLFSMFPQIPEYCAAHEPPENRIIVKIGSATKKETGECVVNYQNKEIPTGIYLPISNLDEQTRELAVTNRPIYISGPEQFLQKMRNNPQAYADFMKHQIAWLRAKLNS